MEYIYSALLLHSAKLPITEDNLTKVVQSIGIAPDQAKIKAVVASLENVNIEDVLKQAAVSVATPAKEEKKEEKKAEEAEEKKAEEAAAGLSALFG